LFGDSTYRQQQPFTICHKMLNKQAKTCYAATSPSRVLLASATLALKADEGFEEQAKQEQQHKH